MGTNACQPAAVEDTAAPTAGAATPLTADELELQGHAEFVEQAVAHEPHGFG